MLRSEGYVFVAGINRFASLLDGIVEGDMDDPYFREIIDADLSTGQHRNPRNQPDYFTTAFFHRSGWQSICRRFKQMLFDCRFQCVIVMGNGFRFPMNA